MALPSSIISNPVPSSTVASGEERVRLVDLSEADAFELVANRPEVLLERIHSGDLTNVELTFAAEALSSARKDGSVAQALDVLLQHGSALVREGAVYGAGAYGLQAFRDRLQALAGNEPSAAVRAAAVDALAD